MSAGLDETEHEALRHARERLREQTLIAAGADGLFADTAARRGGEEHALRSAAEWATIVQTYLALRWTDLP